MVGRCFGLRGTAARRREGRARGRAQEGARRMMTTLRKVPRRLIDEVSSVSRGAGEGVRVMLMKRDDDDVEALLPEAFTKAVDALYESCASIVEDDDLTLDD